MQGKMSAVKCGIVLLVLCMSVTLVQASGGVSSTSMFNPWSPANMAAEKAVDRTLAVGANMPHAGALDGFSSWSLFTDYEFGSNKDKRAGGFDNNFNAYTIGADALYNNKTLWGFMGSFNDAQDHVLGNANRNTIESWTYSLYFSQPINEWMYWGSSFSFGTSEAKTKNVPGTTDTDTYAVAPYLIMMKQMDKLTLSLSPSYVLGYQDVDYPAGNVPSDDTSLMGRLVVMSRASYALTEKMNVSANLNFNQVLHNHGLDGVVDNDHQWFTTGARLGYKFTSCMSGSIGYSTEFDSDFDSDIWHLGLSIVF
jgi:hypothetical protein